MAGKHGRFRAGNTTVHDDPVVRLPVKMLMCSPVYVRMGQPSPQSAHGLVADIFDGNFLPGLSAVLQPLANVQNIELQGDVRGQFFGEPHFS